MVDFPEAESPVNQMVRPRCLRRVVRSARVREGCHVMFLWVGVMLVMILNDFFWLLLLLTGREG